MTDLHTKNADANAVTSVGELNPSVIEAYWTRVEETLRRVFNVASGDAEEAVRQLRQRLENDGSADTQLQFYHLDPFQVAAALRAGGSVHVATVDEIIRYADIVASRC